MKKFCVGFLAATLANVAIAADWDPVGKYGYSKEYNEPDYGKFENHYYLQILKLPKPSGDLLYSVDVDVVSGPTSHICGFKGEGKFERDIFVALPSPDKDIMADDRWGGCMLAITRQNDLSLRVKEIGECRDLFLGGARCGLESEDLKKNDKLPDIKVSIPNP